MTHQTPVIGVTADATPDKFTIGRACIDMVVRAGGTPLVLPCRPGRVDGYLSICDGFILSGGDDPDTRQWGVPLHPRATPIDPERQAFEWALLEQLSARPSVPVLGICLGMQMMALHAGGVLDQHLPDTLPTAPDHWGRKEHWISGALGAGAVESHHRQAIVDAGTMSVVAQAPDGVIEAVEDPARLLWLGVQWHPERTADERLGVDLARRLIAAAGVPPEHRLATGV